MTKLASRISLRITHQLRIVAFARILCLLFGIAVIAAHNAAHAQSCPANIPHLTGTWTVLPYQMPINPIAANVLPTGKVLIVAGSELNATNNSKGAESYRAAIWDPTGTTGSSINAYNVLYDVFCSGVAALPDGRPLVVGGTSDYSFTGDSRASIVDPLTGDFIQSQSMVDARWYATVTTLGDGRVMAMSGLNDTGAVSTTVEIYDLRNAGAGWSAPTNVPFAPPLYPRLALLPNGNVFFTGQGSGGGTNTANSWFFNPTNGTWTASAATTRNRVYGSFVLLPLLPPDYKPKVMNFGGGNPATPSTEIIDLSLPSPTWVAGPNMSSGRIQMNAVLLPDGKVLAEGGSLNNESPGVKGKTADLYDSVSKTFSSAGTASYSRLYHSTALLLPDATVASMGSNPGTHGRYEPGIEIYTPPYLYDANDQLITTKRPSITAISPASGVMGYNSIFTVSYTADSAIRSAVLMRPGSSTHAMDMDQRMIVLCGPPAQQSNCAPASNALTLTTPASSNVAPPGYYMLFLLDNAGVPSHAAFIQLTPYSTVPPVGHITSPANDVTILQGGTVNFGTSDSASQYSWIFPGASPATSTAQNPGNVTFPTPGVYPVTLTLIDSSGNSDPRPPTRTIKVNPTTPDFSISVTPSARTVMPGGQGTFNVTVTPLSGFTGAVNLSVTSEGKFPAGISSGGFSPATINGSGSSTLTMNTMRITDPWALSLTVKGTSGALTHTAATTLLVSLPAPGTLTAVPANGQVSLSWSESTGATSYLLKRGTTPGGPYVTRACPAATDYVDTGLTNGIPYYYVVSAAYSGNLNAGGASADSVEATATPQPPASVPPIPTGLTAQGENRLVSLSWSGSSGATSYNIKRATTSGGPYSVIASPNATDYADASVVGGTTYYYVVSAKNSVGESGNSAQVSATPVAGTSLFTNQTPVNVNQSNGVPYELGMKFKVARAGTINAIRYYKSPSDTGAHVGNIWSSSGTLLATVTFSEKTASGWQQQMLPTPLPVQANTVYVVSVNVEYYYAYTNAGLATSVVNGDVSSVVGNNGVFGNPGAFPTTSYQNSNYFRDVVFVPTPSAPPAQSLFSTQVPAVGSGTNGVPYEMGMKFQVARAGTITAIRYWRAPSDGGTHVGRIWSSTRTLLAQVTFAGESTSGWQQQSLALPLAIQANTTYTVSVNIANNFPYTLSGLANPIVNGDIRSVADGVNGIFGTPAQYPTKTYQNTNYFRDIVFVPN